MAISEKKTTKKDGLTTGKAIIGTVLLGVAGSLAYRGYEGFQALQPHIGTDSFIPYVSGHLHQMEPFMIGRTLDVTSTLFTMNALVASGRPRESVHENEFGLFARREFRLWYKENKKAYALTNAIGTEVLLWSAAFAFPNDWSFYLPVGIFLGATNSLQGIYALKHPKNEQKPRNEEVESQDNLVLPENDSYLQPDHSYPIPPQN